MAKKLDKILSAGLPVLFGVVFVVFWIIFSYHEAISYSRLTGNHVTTWDAMFVDLRVQAVPVEVKESQGDF